MVYIKPFGVKTFSALPQQPKNLLDLLRVTAKVCEVLTPEPGSKSSQRNNTKSKGKK